MADVLLQAGANLVRRTLKSSQSLMICPALKKKSIYIGSSDSGARKDV